MAMLLVVPREELAAERQAMVVGRKPLRELWPVLECLELCFTERVVIGDVRARPTAQAATPTILRSPCLATTASTTREPQPANRISISWPRAPP